MMSEALCRAHKCSPGEERIRQELDQLRSELEKAAVYHTDELERLNSDSTISAGAS